MHINVIGKHVFWEMFAVIFDIVDYIQVIKTHIMSSIRFFIFKSKIIRYNILKKVDSLDRLINFGYDNYVRQIRSNM